MTQASRLHCPVIPCRHWYFTVRLRTTAFRHWERTALLRHGPLDQEEPDGTVTVVTDGAGRP